MPPRPTPGMPTFRSAMSQCPFSYVSKRRRSTSSSHTARRKNAPFTVREPWFRNEKYAFYEYACFEGDVQVRNYINSSRTQRGLTTSEIGDPNRVGEE